MTRNQFCKAALKREIGHCHPAGFFGSYRNDDMVNSKNSFFRILDSNKMKFGQILT